MVGEGWTGGISVRNIRGYSARARFGTNLSDLIISEPVPILTTGASEGDDTETMGPREIPRPLGLSVYLIFDIVAGRSGGSGALTNMLVFGKGRFWDIVALSRSAVEVTIVFQP